MDGKASKVDGWRFNIIETVGFGFSLASVAVAITLWSMSNFQSRAEAEEAKRVTEAKISNLEAQMSQIRSNMDTISRDVSYIRGRLEPKQ